MCKINKEQALQILRNHEIKKLEGRLINTEVLDKKPDWLIVYLPSNEDDFWYCILNDPVNKIGASSVVCISKSTGKVVFDGKSGE